MNFEYTSPKKRPSTSIPIHKKTHNIKGEMDVLATSSLTTPGRTINNKIISPNNLPKIDGLLLSTASSATSTDSFQETFKKTNVKMMTNAETFKTVSKGIGRSQHYLFHVENSLKLILSLFFTTSYMSTKISSIGDF